jgi:SAM-dependent methyltransferase
MTDWRQKTVDTYNRSAKELAEYFQGIGPRNHDIEKGFELIGNISNPKVLEIGCGDGRDAKEIIKHTSNFIGFDISNSFIELARKNAPKGVFEVADAVNFKYQEGLDLVFAFASLLHLDKNEVQEVLSKVGRALGKKGIFFISLKYMPSYTEQIKQDQFGERLFYFYSPEIIKQLAGDAFESVFEDRQVIGKTEWFTIALRKV